MKKIKLKKTELRNSEILYLLKFPSNVTRKFKNEIKNNKNLELHNSDII